MMHLNSAPGTLRRAVSLLSGRLADVVERKNENKKKN